MTTKTDYHAIMELKDKYTPAQRGIVNAAEVETITATLEIKSRNNIELQNVRDMTVMLYGQWADAMRKKDREAAEGDGAAFEKAMEYMDAMSAICCVIDQEKFNRGMEV